MKHSLLPALLLLSCHLLAQPSAFYSTGIGGGGALFSPAINPADDGEMYLPVIWVDCTRPKMGENSYDVVHFTEATVNPFGKVCFTQDTKCGIACCGTNPIMRPGPPKAQMAVIPGLFLPGDTEAGEEKWFIYTDYTQPNRVIWTDYNYLFLSNDGGQTGTLKWTAADFGAGILLSGVFFDGNDIWLGTNEGVLVSHNGGTSFANANFSGIPANEAIMGFWGWKKSAI